METHHLAVVANQIEHDQTLAARADEILTRWQNEPLFGGLFETPQSAGYHAEGPTVRSHVRLILTSLFAILDGKVHLLEIEEFARLKGYGAEIQEMEDTIKENAATFEVFALVHDLGKQFRVSIDDQDNIHYHGHAKDIWRPDVQAVLGKLAEAYRLNERDVKLLNHLVAEHMDPLHRLNGGHDPKHVDTLARYAQHHGLDADDFIDALQAGVLLDQVFGSRQLKGGKYFTRHEHLVNFFIAEGEYAPWKREKHERDMAERHRREEHKVLEAVGLDGHGLMKLTGMHPGRELGVLVKEVVSAVRGGELPSPADSWKDELARRISIAREKLGASK